jgi:hypothetical protein
MVTATCKATVVTTMAGASPPVPTHRSRSESCRAPELRAGRLVGPPSLPWSGERSRCADGARPGLLAPFRGGRSSRCITPRALGYETQSHNRRSVLPEHRARDNVRWAGGSESRARRRRLNRSAVNRSGAPRPLVAVTGQLGVLERLLTPGTRARGTAPPGVGSEAHYLPPRTPGRGRHTRGQSTFLRLPSHRHCADHSLDLRPSRQAVRAKSTRQRPSGMGRPFDCVRRGGPAQPWRRVPGVAYRGLGRLASGG